MDDWIKWVTQQVRFGKCLLAGTNFFLPKTHQDCRILQGRSLRRSFSSSFGSRKAVCLSRPAFLWHLPRPPKHKSTKGKSCALMSVSGGCACERTWVDVPGRASAENPAARAMGAWRCKCFLILERLLVPVARVF